MGYKVSYAQGASFTTCDLSPHANCTRYCARAGTCPGRMLRKATPLKKAKPGLSESARSFAVKYGTGLLDRNRDGLFKYDPNNPNGNLIEVLYEENGEIYEVWVTAKDYENVTAIII
jgi:hypothetical protein